MSAMEPARKKIALLVYGCDRYEFLYRGFAACFARYWDFSIPCTYYFATEEKDVTIPPFRPVKSGPGPWADRLVRLLRQEVTEDYVLLFQEDMWLAAPVNKAFFVRLFDTVLQQGWKQVKLHSGNTYHTHPTELFIEGFNVARLDNQASGYLMSHQVTLWEKEYLIAQLHKNEHPWRNERKGTQRLKKLDPPIYHVDYFADGGQPPNNQNQDPIGRSVYYTVSGRGMLNENTPRFIELLRQGSPEEQAYAAELQHHMDHHLTHDGLPGIRKESLFKRLKRKLRGR